MKKNKKWMLAGIISITIAFLEANAYAMVTEKDIKVFIRTVSFVEDGPKGTVEVAVVTDGGVSKTDAESFVSLADGKKDADITLHAKIISPAGLTNTAAKVVFIPAGMNAELDAIHTIAGNKKLITISNSMECINLKKCAVFMSSDPTVDIVVSKSTAYATGVSFGAAFSMIIKKMP